mmetsp:Transcript_103564/g.331913  ORF Transcript_103564/g.331913 Transcript_103564/m.331913 type:complete len:295 (-) Transcript_103564:40-924(-)
MKSSASSTKPPPVPSLPAAPESTLSKMPTLAFASFPRTVSDALPLPMRCVPTGADAAGGGVRASAAAADEASTSGPAPGWASSAFAAVAAFRFFEGLGRPSLASASASPPAAAADADAYAAADAYAVAGESAGLPRLWCGMFGRPVLPRHRPLGWLVLPVLGCGAGMEPVPRLAKGDGQLSVRRSGAHSDNLRLRQHHEMPQQGALGLVRAVLRAGVQRLQVHGMHHVPFLQELLHLRHGRAGGLRSRGRGIHDLLRGESRQVLGLRVAVPQLRHAPLRRVRHSQAEPSLTIIN